MQDLRKVPFKTVRHALEPQIPPAPPESKERPLRGEFWKSLPSDAIYAMAGPNALHIPVEILEIVEAPYGDPTHTVSHARDIHMVEPETTSAVIVVEYADMESGA